MKRFLLFRIMHSDASLRVGIRPVFYPLGKYIVSFRQLWQARLTDQGIQKQKLKLKKDRLCLFM